MLFTDRESRERIFEMYDNNPCRCSYGAAMEHAATTNLGIWGERVALERDCARILLYELERFTIEARPKVLVPAQQQQFGESRRRLDIEDRFELDIKVLDRIRDAVRELGVGDIRRTRAFYLAFSKARSGPENETATALDEMGVKDHNMRVTLSEEEEMASLTHLHIQVIKELIGWPGHLEVQIGR